VQYTCLPERGARLIADVGYRKTGFKSDTVQPTFGIYMQQRRILDSRDGNVYTAEFL